MTATIPSSAVVPANPVFNEPEQLALAGFLASYSGLTREAYMLDLRQFTTWCHQHDLRLFTVRRADIECFARDLEAKGRARSTVSRPPGHYRRTLQVRGRGRPARPLSSRARPAAAAGLRIPRRRPGPQRGRRPPGRRRARHGRRARTDLAAATAPWPSPVKAAERPSSRSLPEPRVPSISPSGNAATARSSSPPAATPGPAQSRADRPARRPPHRARQEHRTAHAPACIHHRRTRRRRPRCPGHVTGGQPGAVRGDRETGHPTLMAGQCGARGAVSRPGPVRRRGVSERVPAGPGPRG